MDLKVVRNVVIIAALAALVAFAPGGGTGSQVILQVFSILFLAALVMLAYRLYREHRVALYALGDRNRALLYGAIGLAVLAVAGTQTLWDTGAGTLLWFVMVGLAAFAAYTVFRASREY